MKYLAMVLLGTLLCAGFAESLKSSSRQATNSNPKAPSAQSNYNPKAPQRNYGSAPVQSPSGPAGYQSITCGIGYGTYPAIEESDSVPRDALKDQPAIVNAAEATRRLAKYESQLQAWCMEIESGFSSAEITRKVESYWRAAGGPGPAPADLITSEMGIQVSGLGLLDAYVAYHMGLLRLRALSQLTNGDIRAIGGNVLPENGRPAFFVGCGPLKNGICPASQIVFEVPSLDAVGKGLTNLPSTSVVSAYLDELIQNDVTYRALLEKWKQAMALTDAQRAKPYEDVFRAFEQQRGGIIRTNQPPFPIPNQRLFAPPVYESLAAGGNIFLYAVCVDGLQAVDEFYFGVPIVVEAQYDPPLAKPDVSLELQTSVGKLKITAKRYDVRGYIFRSAPITLESESDKGETFNPSLPPKKRDE